MPYFLPACIADSIWWTLNHEVTKDECLRVVSSPNEFLKMIGEPLIDEREALQQSSTPHAGQPKVAARR